MNYTIRDATPDEIEKIIPLLPRLADFEVPNGRDPRFLWEGDADLLRQWAQGTAPNCLVKVAVSDNDDALGTAITTMREELLNHEPSAHLEVLVVDPQADGQGIGKALLRETELAVRKRGAQSLSLHVFANNKRARHVYEKMGFNGELIRYIKMFE